MALNLFDSSSYIPFFTKLGTEFIQLKISLPKFYLIYRNILLLSKDICKISDFGLSRVFNDKKDYYEANEAGLWPIKW